MRKVIFCLDNEPVRKIPFIAIYCFESRSTIELLLMFGACRVLGHLLRFLGVRLAGRNAGNYRVNFTML